MQGSNLVDVHRRSTREEVNAEDADDEQGGATHKHQRQLHGSILLGTATPNTYQQVHRDKGNLVEHEHREHISADEETVDTRRQKGKPEEVLLGQRLQLPRGKRTGKHDDARQQQHDDRDAVDADAIGNIQRLEPRGRGRQQHHISIAAGTLLDEVDGQPNGEGEQRRRACHHHATYLIERLSEPEACQHQDGNQNE